MKITGYFIAVVLALSTRAFASDFSPTLLKLSADQYVQYDFDGSQLDIPVIVSGSPAGIIFAVFTKNRADQIAPTSNGYLGWHFVNGVDTCIYYSPLRHVQEGENLVTWDGKDQDGRFVPEGEYRFYLWAFDNQGAKQHVSRHVNPGPDFGARTFIQEVGEYGLPLANPVLHQIRDDIESSVSHLTQWILGSDPDDETMRISSRIELAEGWEPYGRSIPEPDDFDYLYLRVGNETARQGAMQKLRFVPGGVAEIVGDWGGEAPFSEIFRTQGGSSAGVATDGVYLFTTDSNNDSSDEPDADFYIYDMDGYIVEEIDISPWWSSTGDYEQGGQMNGGPDSFASRGRYIFLNSHANCLNQMIYPYRYLDSGEFDDLVVWSNGNGDYIGDKNFEETSVRPWICNDFNPGPYKYSISADAKLFSAVNAYDVGAVSFGLFAPDGTGLGYFAYAGETAGEKYVTMFVDSDTPFDGIYCDWYETRGAYKTAAYQHELMYIGHDSIQGQITGHGGGGSSIYLTLDSPKGSEVFQQGETCLITWTEHYIDKIKIEVSFDGGNKWSLIAEEVNPDLGEYEWEIPVVSSNNCRIRISKSDNNLYMDSNTVSFTIGASLSLSGPEAGSILGIDTPYTVQWTYYGVEYINLLFSSDGGETWQSVVNGADAEEGKYDWRFPSEASSECLFRIEDAENPNQYALSEVFSVSDRFIMVTAPAGFVTLFSNQLTSIRWVSNNIELVNIDVSRQDSENWIRVVSLLDASLGEYSWTVPRYTSTECRIRISETAGTGISDTSDVFNIYCGYCGSDYTPETEAVLKWVYGEYDSGGNQTGNNFHIVKSTPIVGGDGTVYIGGDKGGFFALNPDGTLKWRAETTTNVYSPVAMGSDGSLYFGDAGDNFYVFGPDGHRQWSVEMDHFYSTPAITPDQHVLIGEYNGYLHAFNSVGVELWKYKTGSFIYSSPAIGADGTIYIASGSGALEALTPSGQLQWKFDTGGQIPQGSPSIGADGTVYICSKANKLFAVNPNGGLKWDYPLDKPHDCSAVIAADGTIYIGSGGTMNSLHAVNPDGTEKWIFHTGGFLVGSAAIGSDGVIYFTNKEGYCFALNPDGSLKWCFKGASETESSPAIAPDGTVYFGAGPMYAFRTESYGYQEGSPWPCLVFNNTRASTVVPVNRPELHTASGRLLGPGATPLGYIEVSVNGLITVSDSNGYFSLSLMNGDYTLTIDSDSIYLPDSIDFTVNGSDVVIPLPDNRLHKISGQLVHDALPVSGVWARLNDQQVRTGADGAFTFEIPDGSYTITLDTGSDRFPDSVLAEVDGGDVTLPPIQLHTVRWNLDFAAGEASIPASGPDGTVYCVMRDESYSLEAVSQIGGKKWSYGFSQGLSDALSVGPDGIVFLPAWFSVQGIDESGMKNWELNVEELGVGDAPALGPDGNLYFGSHTHLYAVRPDSSLIWRFPAGGKVPSSPAVDITGTVYFSCMDGYVYALNPDGSLKWKYGLGVPFEATPAIGLNGVIYVGGTDYALHAIGRDGARLWKYVTDAEICSKASALDDGTVLFTNDNDVLYALNPDGSLKWRKDNIFASDIPLAVTVFGEIYAVTTGGLLTAFDSEGQSLWEHSFGNYFINTPFLDHDGGMYISMTAKNGTKKARLTAVDLSFDKSMVYVSGYEEENGRKESSRPAAFALSQNSPNPFNPATSIPFSLGKESPVTLAVYAITGEKIATLINERLSSGRHSITWDASNHASGVYFVRMQAGEFVETKKMTLVK